MLNWKLASLVLLSGGFSVVACNKEDTTSDGGGGVGATTSTGGTSTTGGNSGLGGLGGGSGKPEGCGEYVVSTGVPASIDDFEGRTGSTTMGMGGAPITEWAALPDNDGRAGQWAHGTFLNKASDPEVGGIGQFEVMDGALRFWCEAGASEDHKQCNTDWNKDKPWEQYASLDTLFQPYNATAAGCYDVSTFTGIKFKAKSTGTDKIRVQLTTTDAKPDTGETYQSPESTLSTSFKDILIPFSKIKQPSWSTVKAPLDLRGLISMSIVVRTVDPKTKAADGADGEKLLPYDITIDDVEFY